MAGFVQGGTAEVAPTEGLLSLGSLYYEPIWLFHKRNRPLRAFSDLRGLSIQVGEEGSGIRPLAIRLLRDSGVTAQNSSLLALTSEGAATALERYLPFWIAVTAERWALLLLPVVGIMLPLIGILPSLYNSQMRKQVTRWYREVHDIDHALAHATREEAQTAAQQLRDVQARLAEIPPPPSGLMGEYYALKQHVEWLIERADARAASRHSPR
jgi:NMT1-like family